MKEFKGDIKSIKPSKLINKDKVDNFETFFLILGMIFNDLKGFVLFDEMMKYNYRKPEPDEISPHSGEWAGCTVQANKFLISTVNSFFEFLEKNRDVLSSIEFQLLLKKLDPDTREKWNQIVKLISGETTKSSEFIEILKRIRSNVTSHYDHSNKELRKGFIRFFFGESEREEQKLAMYSLGGDMETTRFYYSDAALQGYISSLFSEEQEKKIRKVIRDMNLIIISLMKAYLSSVK